MAGDMRIAIIGQDAFGGSVLDALVQAGETVVAVFLPPDREGRPPDPIKAAAQGGYGAGSSTIVEVGAGELLVNRALINLAYLSGQVSRTP